MIQFGRRVEGKLVAIPKDMLTESVPDAVYEVHVKTEGIPNPEECAKHLVKELPAKVKGLKIIWIGFEGDTIKMQIVGSPFAWSLLLFLLPTILAIIGIVMVLVSVYSVITAIPTWAWALLLIGIGLIVFAKPITEKITPITVVRRAG